MLLLGRRGLEALTPCGAQTEVVADGEHTRDLRRQMEAKLLVMVQSQAGGDVGRERGIESVAELILHVCSRRIILCLTAIHTHRSLQIVVTPLQPATKTVVVGQREDALQMSHRTTLVTLQHLVVAEIGIVSREVTPLVQSVSHRPFCGIVIIVRMTVPVHVERQLVCLVPFPDTACCQTLIPILQIIEFHVRRIFTTGTVDALPIGAALGIELQTFQGLVGQTLGHLPVRMAVHGHIT